MQIQNQIYFARSLRQRLWRWHFFAGIIICPFIILLATTGSIYLFEPEYAAYEESKINALVTNKQADPVPVHQLVQNILASRENSRLKKIVLPGEDDPTLEIEIARETKNEMGHMVSNAHHGHAPLVDAQLLWVNQYSGEILESKNPDHRLMARIKKLHSELLLGQRGSYIIEIVACWAILLVISGIMLRRGTRLSHTPPKEQRRWNRQTHVSTHQTIGILVAVPFLLLLLTGLPWTQLWGTGFKEFKSLLNISGPKQVWNVTLKSSDNPRVTNPEDSLWNISDVESGQHHTSTKLNLSALTAVLADRSLKTLSHPIYVFPPKPNNGVWTVRSMPRDRAMRQTMHFDQHTGERILTIGFEDHSTLDQVVSHGISFHEGALFGWFNKILVLTTALSTILLSLLGITMWWKRRPRGRLGAPNAQPATLPASWVTSILLLAIFLPAAGICMMVIFALEKLWLSASSLLKPIEKIDLETKNFRRM